MVPPFTAFAADALLASEAAVALTLSAVLWQRPLPSRAASVVFVLAVWSAALSTVKPEHVAFLAAVGKDGSLALRALQASAGLGSLAVLLGRRWPLAVLAVAGEVGLWWLCAQLPEARTDLAELHLAWLGLLLGLQYRALVPAFPSPAASPPRRSFKVDDLALFLLATLLGSVASVVVLERFANSGDEVAYTFQSALFAHFKAYASTPPCEEMFANYWVFNYQGRAFAQYTPGWPLAMAAFQRIGAVWLATPVTHGLMAVGVARLARRGAAGLGARSVEEGERLARAAGILAALAGMAGASALLNAGSRFPHTLVCACFAWSIEAVCVVATPGATPANGAKWVAGLGLGGVTALMLATRAADAAALGAGVFLYFCLALARRRMSWRGVAGAAVSFGLVAGLTLVILRLQIGEWFRTGYSLTHLFMPNNVPQWGPPQISQLNVGVPLAYGSYMWWPCAPALGAAGIALAWHGPERRVLFMLACGTLALFTLYSFSVFGRYGWDNEYGPRLQLPVVVTMAVGGGLLLAPLWERARAAARGEGGWRARLRALPALAAACAALVAVGRIAMLVYPGAHAEVHERDAILRAVKDAHLHDAIVGMQPGRTPIDMKDLAQNLPGDPAPHVLLLELHRREDVACAKSQFPDKKWYRVEGRDEVKLVAE